MKTILFSILLCMVFSFFVLSQNVKPYDITNVEPSGGKYIITYYNNPVDDNTNIEYEVSIRLLRESVKEFSVTLTDVSGAVGTGRFVGSNLKITWDYLKQFPKGLPYNDIVFELDITKHEKRVVVEQESESGGSSWIYYVGGAVIIGGGVTAAVLLSHKNTATTTTLPDPPQGRP